MANFIETLRFSDNAEIETAFLATSVADRESTAHDVLGHIISTVTPEETAPLFRDIFKGYDDLKAHEVRKGIVDSLETVAAQPEKHPHLAIASLALLETFRVPPSL